MDFEKEAIELESIIKKLEGGNVNLQDGMQLFERGTQIINNAQKELTEAKGKITIIKENIETDLE